MLNRLAREWLPEFEALCDNSTPADDVEKDFYNLTHEILRLLREDELFTYVIHPEVPGTNNESERSLRGAAQDRRTGRTRKPNSEPGVARCTVSGHCNGAETRIPSRSQTALSKLVDTPKRIQLYACFTLLRLDGYYTFPVTESRHRQIGTQIPP